MTSPVDVLRQQGGVARVARLRSLGVSQSDLRAAIAIGAIARTRKGWVRTPDASPAVVTAVSLGGRLACVSAAQHLGLWTADDEEAMLHIARPRHAGRTFGDPAGCVEHWQSQTWSSRDSPIESVDALLRQALLCLPYEDALTLVDSALNKHHTTPDRVRRIVETLPRRFAVVLDDMDESAESGLETLCRLRLAALAVRIRSQVEFAGIGRVDLIVGERVILEADGKAWHDGERAFHADRSRDLALIRLGYIVIRVGYHHVMHEWALVDAAVRGLIGRGEHLWSASHRRFGLGS